MASKAGLILRLFGWIASSTVLHLIALWYLESLLYRGGVNPPALAQSVPLSVFLINQAQDPIAGAPKAATGQTQEALTPEDVDVPAARQGVAASVPLAPQASNSSKYLASGQLTRQPMALQDVDLNGPEFNKVAIEGVFVLKLHIDSHGHVTGVTSSTNGDQAKAFLDRLAECFGNTQFSPGEVNGRAVDSEIEIKVVSRPLPYR